MLLVVPIASEFCIERVAFDASIAEHDLHEKNTGFLTSSRHRLCHALGGLQPSHRDYFLNVLKLQEGKLPPNDLAVSDRTESLFGVPRALRLDLGHDQHLLLELLLSSGDETGIVRYEVFEEVLGVTEGKAIHYPSDKRDNFRRLLAKTRDKIVKVGRIETVNGSGLRFHLTDFEFGFRRRVESALLRLSFKHRKQILKLLDGGEGNTNMVPFSSFSLAAKEHLSPLQLRFLEFLLDYHPLQMSVPPEALCRRLWPDSKSHEWTMSRSDARNRLKELKKYTSEVLLGFQEPRPSIKTTPVKGYSLVLPNGFTAVA